jgi:hypothetical protein
VIYARVTANQEGVHWMDAYGEAVVLFECSWTLPGGLTLPLTSSSSVQIRKGFLRNLNGAGLCSSVG